MFYLIQSMVQQGMSFSRMLAFGVGYLFAIVLAFGLHEYAHALELYNELGSIYIERRVDRENKAQELEKKYIKK